MTYTVAANPEGTGEIGLATVSHSFNVVAKTVAPTDPERCEALVASQSFSSRPLGRACLQDLGRGVAPQGAGSAWLRNDPARELRQILVVTPDRGCSASTGRSCVEYAGQHVAGNGRFAVAGNMLASEAVLSGLTQGFVDAGGDDGPLAESLLRGLEAAHALGGDLRGDRSAGLLVRGRDRAIDLRVADHDDPVSELRRLYLRWQADQAIVASYAWLLEGGPADRVAGLLAVVGEQRPTLGIDVQAMELVFAARRGECEAIEAATGSVRRLAEGLLGARDAIRRPQGGPEAGG